MNFLKLGVFVLVFLGTQARADDTLFVGVAKIDITPQFPTRLSGYAARKTEAPAGGGPIWAKALAVGEDGKKPVVLIAIDSLGVSDAMVAELAAKLEKAGISREGVCVSASHTHSAPALKNVAPHIFGRAFTPDEQAGIDRYTKQVSEQLLAVALAALKDRRPSLVSWGEGKVGFANNRRTKGGPVDHALPVLRVTTPEGAIRAILVNYACHCTTLNPADNVVHGDWAGCAQEMLEHDHPGAIALTVIGCGADSNPIAMHGPSSIDKARAHAKLLVDEANRLLKTPLTPLKNPPAAQALPVALPFDTLPTREQLEALVKKGSYPGYNASTFLAKLDKGEAIRDHIDYRVTSWLFGDDLAMVFLPGEVVVDYALRLKKEFDPSRLWLNAYSNDSPCYIPSERILKEGGYEGGGAMVYYAQPTKLKTGVEDIIIKAVHELVPARFSFAPMPPKLSPAQAIQAIKIKPELRVELVAAEPLIQSPVAIDWGADGTLWVAEMRDYPLGMDGQFSPGGVIKALRDTDGDGTYDTATEFLRDVPMPTGVMAYRDGVLVTAAPEIFFARDTNGDGKADEKRVIAHGFTTENQQARINGLSFNLDNHIYGASGLFGGRVFARVGEKEQEVELGGRDFRFSFDLTKLEPVTGLSQQGRTHDDWGEQFGCNNSNWIFHFPLADEYAKRNPFVATPSPSVYLARYANSAQLYPSSDTLERYNEPQAANHVTSACGVCIYRDTLLDIQYRGDAFICEPVHNLVHHLHLSPSGLTFVGNRSDDERDREFLSSTDPWFRPVQMRIGPDGALYVVDMARFVIEHPRWISPEVLRTLDVRAGHDRGRIFRILPVAGNPRPVPKFKNMRATELVATLDHPNGTVREMAQRLLLEHGGNDAIAPLITLATRAKNAAGRTHALWTLEALGGLTAPLLREALTDVEPHVRAQAVKLAESRFRADPDLAAACMALKGDPDARVRFQLALSLGSLDTEAAFKVLASLGVTGVDDPWMRAAVLSSSVKGASTILAALISRNDEHLRGRIESLVSIIAKQNEPAVVASAYRALVDTQGVPPAGWRIAALAKFVREVDPKRHELFVVDANTLAQFDTAARAAINGRPTEAKAAIEWLGRPGTSAKNLLVVIGLLEPTTSPELQSVAVSTLARTATNSAIGNLIDRWKSFGPSVRATVLDALSEFPGTSHRLLDAIAANHIPLIEIDPAHRQRLMTSPDERVRERAQKLLGIDTAKEGRAKILAQYSECKTAQGDAERGALVFANVCAGCHHLAGKGTEIGPDLAALTDRTPDAILTAIFDPNRDVDARYIAYSAELRDGRSASGLIASETGSTIILKRQGGETEAILRANLESLASSGKSLMPEGLETQLTPAQTSDLLAFLMTGSTRPKSLAGNTPRLVRPDTDGVIRLEAKTAEVFGSTLIFEPTFSNLGYWQSPDDRAGWTFTVDRASRFTLTMEFACPDDSSGNAYELRIGDTRVRKVAGSTGAWSAYHSLFVYEAKLAAGTNRLEIRPVGPIRNALFDLRAINLTPRP